MFKKTSNWADKLTVVRTLFLLLFSVFAHAQTTSFRYEGVLQGGSVSTGTSTQNFTVTLDRPDCPANSLGLTPWTGNVTVVDGAFTLNPSFSSSTLQNALNPATSFGAPCSAGVYSPRRLKITWNTSPSETFYVPLDDSPRASFSSVAANSNAIGGVSVQPNMTCASGSFLKYNSGLTRFECQPLAASDVPTLSASVISSGTFSSAQLPAPAGDISGTYAAMSVERIRGTNVSATAPTTNQVLKYNGSAWAPAADDTGAAVGDASYVAKGVVQINTDAATSGLQMTSGVLSLPGVGTAGTYGSAILIPIISTDAKGRITNVTTTAPSDVTKLPLAGGTMSGNLNMGAQQITNVTSISTGSASLRDLILNDADSSNNVTIRTPTSLSPNYTLTLPADDGSNGQVLSTDGTGTLSWITPAGLGALTAGTMWVGNASNVPTPVYMSGEGSLSNTGILDVTIGAESITSGILPVARGGTGATAFAANELLVSNGTGNAIQGFFCSLGSVLAFDAGGTAICEATNGANQLLRLDSGSSISITGSISTNSYFSATGMAAPAVSATGRGRIYFDSTANKFRVSENSGSYVDLITPPTPAGTNKQVQFNNSGAVGGASLLFWDNVNMRLGIGADTPQEDLVLISPSATGTSLTVATPGNNATQTANINIMTRHNTTASVPVFSSAQTKGWQFYGISNLEATNPNSLGLGYFDGTTWAPYNMFFKVNGGASDIKVGIGTDVPLNDLSVSKPNRDTSFSVSNSQTTSVDRFPSAIVENHMGATVFTGSPRYVLRSSRGSEAAPTATGLNDKLGKVSAQGYGGGAYAESAAIEFTAMEAFTASARGTAIRFYTTPNATTTQTQRMIIDQDGTVTVAGAVSARNYNTPNYNAGSTSFLYSNGSFQTSTSECSAATLTISGIPDGGRMTIVFSASGACAFYSIGGLTIKWKGGTAPTAGGYTGQTHKYEFIRAGTLILADWSNYN